MCQRNRARGTTVQTGQHQHIDQLHGVTSAVIHESALAFRRYSLANVGDASAGWQPVLSLRKQSTREGRSNTFMVGD